MNKIDIYHSSLLFDLPYPNCSAEPELIRRKILKIPPLLHGNIPKLEWPKEVGHLKTKVETTFPQARVWKIILLCVSSWSLGENH